MLKRPDKKVGERIYLDVFVRAMSWQCTVEDEGERPDFVVRLGPRLLGIEVRRVHADQMLGPSKQREAESLRASWMNRLARDYYDRGGKPARVQLQFEPSYFERIRGKIPPDVRERLLERLHARVCRMARRPTLTSRLRDKNQSLLATMWVRALPTSFGRYTRWTLMNDSMAFVRRLTRQHIEDVVAEKARKLPDYRQRVPEVVLLIVADGFLASGLVRYEGGQVNAHGFEAVYVLQYPSGHVDKVA